MPEPTEQSPWWRPDRHQDRRPILIARGRIKAAIRSWFESQGFVEVETSVLQVSPGNETHLSAFATELIGPDGGRLHTARSRNDQVASDLRLHLHRLPETFGPAMDGAAPMDGSGRFGACFLERLRP